MGWSAAVVCKPCEDCGAAGDAGGSHGRRKDAQGSAEKALGILSALGHCQWPLLKRKKKDENEKIPFTIQITFNYNYFKCF